tara:strand:- start:176 stop:469 length:294 start_codon:yes stop_codon:yes gene_type:complete
MTFGGEHVWTNFSYGYRNESPNGWLLNPDRSRLILFTRNEKSARNNNRIFAHSYYTNALGEPMAIKSSSQMHLNDAWDKWHDLQLEGWTFEEIELPE